MTGSPIAPVISVAPQVLPGERRRADAHEVQIGHRCPPVVACFPLLSHRVALPPAKRAFARRCALAFPHPGEIRLERPDLRFATRLEGPSGGRRALRRESGRPADAIGQHSRPAEATQEAQRRWRTCRTRYRTERAEPRLRGRRSESEVAADFTYIWTGEGWPFLAVVVDLFSRQVAGWSMQPRMTAQLVLDALMMALWRRGKPTELLHHSDQGSQPSTPARNSSAY